MRRKVGANALCLASFAHLVRKRKSPDSQDVLHCSCYRKRKLRAMRCSNLDGATWWRSITPMSNKPFIEDAVSIIVPVKSVRDTVAFYLDILGFEDRIVSDDGSFAILIHGEAAVQLVQTDNADALRATSENISIYLWAKHVDELYAHLKQKLDTLPEGRVRAPFDQPYGKREFHVKAPDGCLLFFGKNNG